MKPFFVKILITLFVAVFCFQQLEAQYFGKNKPRYQRFDFEVVHTPHFEIYHYLKNPAYVRQLADDCEKWEHLHQRIFHDSLFQNNPVLFYNDHADFQQTNAIGGSIGVGTGGVTEALKNRVILPLAMSNQQTDHVLGHEMVHAFQYSMILNGDSTSLQSLGNLPLWMVEGLAEYMSIGNVDAHTAMWMRDAVLNDDVPDLRKLNNPKYFPYRWGQVFWAFLTGWKGDDIIKPFFQTTAKYGFDVACKSVLGIDEKELSELWTSTLKKHYGEYVNGKKEKPVGKKILSTDNAGRMNISPALSPNGRYVIFYSEKDIFTLDLFLADARTGKIIRKIASTLRDGHLDDFSFIESAGTWSPDGKEFAFVAVSQGDNVLIIKDVETGKTKKELRLKDLPAFSSPAWSPDGKSIIVAGLVQGQVDLFSIELKNKKVTRLTNDVYSEMLPTWSLDGSRLAFSTDQLSVENGKTDGKWVFNLAIMDPASGKTEQIAVFPGADNMNPVFDKDGNVLFVSNRDGFRNLYRYEPAGGKVFQLTDLLTGVSGITPYAPAITVGGDRNRVLYTHFYKGDYLVYEAEPKEFLNTEVAPDAVNFEPAMLPRINKRAPDLVNAGLENQENVEKTAADSITQGKYKPKFKLDFVTGGGGVGIGTNTFGSNTLLAGGVTMLFSDILGDHQLVSTLAINGEIFDAGGQVAYFNQKNRIGWGLGFTHIPYPSVSYPTITPDVLETNQGNFNVWKQEYLIQRIFEDRLDVFAQYPFSVTQRIEAGASGAYYSSRIDQITNYYAADPNYQFIGGYIGQDKEKLDAPPGFDLYTVSGAYVGDNSFFGVASPLAGYRFRLGMEGTFGTYKFYSPTVDFRYYQYLKPISLAFRLTHFGRYGGNSDELFPIFIGYPWFVRGYQQNYVNENVEANDLFLDQLLGSKVALGGFEVRLPFTGPERLSLIKSNFLLTELALFLDGGVAWFDYRQFKDIVRDENDDFLYRKAKPVFSTGVSLRLNLFGAMVLEPYLSRPLQKSSDWIFGLNIVPGW